MARELAPGFAIVRGSPLDRRLTEEDRRRRLQTTQGGGFEPSALISEGGGLAGALAGGATGAALGSVVPVVGTTIGGLIGAGLGGFLGGTGGSAVEQQVRDEEIDVGKALREGALEGLFSAGPVRLGRAAVAGGKALRAGAKAAGREAIEEGAQRVVQKPSSIAEALQAAEGSISGPGLLRRTGQTLKGEARGVDIGARLSGARIGPNRVQELNTFIDDVVKPKGGSAAKQLEGVESFIGRQSNELSQAITKSNRNLTAADKRSIIDTFEKRFAEGVVGKTPRQTAIASDLITRVRQAKDIKSLDNLRKIVDENINFARNVASPEPAAEQVYKSFRQILTDDVANKVGAAKPLKSNLSKAFDAEELLLNRAAQRGSGVSPAGITLPGRAAQTAESVAGRTLERTGRALESRRPLATGARIFAGSSLAGGDQPPATLEDALLTEDLGQETLGADFGGQPQEAPVESTNPFGFSLDQVAEGISNAFAAGDMDAVAELQDMYTLIQDYEGAQGGGGPNVTKVTAQQYGLAQTGLQGVQQLRQLLQTDPGVIGRTATPGRGIDLLGIGGRIAQATDTAQYDAVGYNIADALLRLSTGAQANEEEIRKLQSQIMPRAGDSPETVELKLQQVEQRLAPMLSLAGG